MKRLFITFLFVSLFVTANTILANKDNKKTNEPAKVENTGKKASETKNAKSCCEMKESCTGQAKENSSCCSEKSTSKTTSACCTNTSVANDTKKSSGKKTN